MVLSSTDILKKAQKGLFYSTPDFGSFVNANYKESLDLDDVQVQNRIIRKCRKIKEYAIKLEDKYPSSRPRVIVGFDPARWKKWDPSLVDLEQRPEKYLVETSTKFLETGGDLFFYIKAECKEAVESIEEALKRRLSKVIQEPQITRSSPSCKRILQRSFEDGLINAADAESLVQHSVIGENVVTGKPGATYMMTQQFKFDWLVLGNMHKSEKEDMIGRRMMSNCIIPTNTPRSHIFRAHFIPEDSPRNVINKHRVMFRQSLPYGTSNTGRGREEGLFYLSFSNTTNAFKDVLENIVGNDERAAAGEVTADILLNAVQPLKGTWWYVPSADELHMETSTDRNFDLKDHWNIRSSNPYMFYNQNEYLYRMTSGSYDPGDEPSARVLRLLGYAFLQWNDQWFKQREIPPIKNLGEYLQNEPDKAKAVMSSSVMIRKSWATKVTLGELFTTSKEEEMESSDFFGNKADLFNIHPDEVIVGRMPNHSLGLGKVAMPYLHEGNEKMEAFLKGLSENASIGHIIPNIGLALEKGIPGLIKEIQERRGQLDATENRKEEEEFLEGCIISLEGVQNYIKNYSALAKHLATAKQRPNSREYKFTDVQKTNLNEIAKRMNKLANDKPETFVEAAQLIFSVHCCLHLIGEPTSIGRLDQMLQPFLRNLSDNEAQEIIDCFFLKLGERVQFNKTLLVDRNTWGTCAVPYRSDGMFPNGDSINQWVQQLTLGGKASGDNKQSACNKVTMLCLKAARRLPLNAPCVSLRVHSGIDGKYLREAARSILSGGAHPIILNDDRLVDGLQDVLKTFKKDVTSKDLKKTFDLACDGCYEPLFAGSTEFAFTYIPLLQILEMAINQGATYSSAGPSYLNGAPQSLPTVPPSKIRNFKDVLRLFRYHFEVKSQHALYGLLSNYGNLASVCPSPLLSSLIDGCLQTKRDLTNGGAKYKIISVMHVGFSNTVDSLYAIKMLCFKQGRAILSLDEMVTCLKNDWGNVVREPTHDYVAGEIRKEYKVDFYHEVRDQALKLPKFGTATAVKVKAMKKIADFLADCVANTMKKLTGPDRDPNSPLSRLLEDLKAKYSKKDSEFELLFTPGSGTFEGYVGWGLSCGASADGRRRGAPIATDMSAAPSPQDLPPHPKNTNLYE